MLVAHGPTALFPHPHFRKEKPVRYGMARRARLAQQVQQAQEARNNIEQPIKATDL
jgi:hypothetical protein